MASIAVGALFVMALSGGQTKSSLRDRATRSQLHTRSATHCHMDVNPLIASLQGAPSFCNPYRPTLPLWCLSAAALAVDAVGLPAHGRNLLNTATSSAAQKVNQCQWDAETSTCDATDAVNIMYAVRSKPVSPYLW